MGTAPGHLGLAGLQRVRDCKQGGLGLLWTRGPWAHGEMLTESAWEPFLGWVLGKDWATFSAPLAFQSFVQHQPTTFFRWEIGL